MNIDQLAAEAARKWCEAHGLNEFKIHSLTAIIQSAIEKAHPELTKQIGVLERAIDRRNKIIDWHNERNRAAHGTSAVADASEQGAVAKLLAALREIVSYDLNCAHEAIAQAAIYDFEASQRPTPATNPRCPTCGEPVPDSMLNKILDAVMTPATEGKEGT